MKIYKNNDTYRIGDLFFAHYPCGLRWKNERKIILTDPKYENTILFDYLTNKTKERDYDTLRSACHRFIDKNKCETPKKDELVIHLRLGDTMNRFPRRNPKTDESFIDYLKKFNYSKISSVTILAVINFGGYKENNDNRYDVKREEQSIFRFNTVNNFFNNLSLPTKHFSKSVDEDFCYGATAVNLITTVGGFSDLMAAVSKLHSPRLKK